MCFCVWARQECGLGINGAVARESLRTTGEVRMEVTKVANKFDECLDYKSKYKKIRESFYDCEEYMEVTKRG